MKKLLITALVLFLCAAALAACGTDDNDSSQKIFGWVTSGADTTINPHAATLFANAEIVDLILVSLYGWIPSDCRQKEVLVPRIALGEPVTYDGYTWTININPEARFANGTPITAHTFIYSWQMGLSPLLAYISAPNIFGGHVEIVNGEAYFAQGLEGREAVSWEDVGLRAIDGLTLEIVTTKRYTPFDVMLHFSHRATAPVYEPLYEAGMNAERTSTLYGTSLEFFMGNGPFTLTSWTKGSERVFARNERFLFADEIHLDGIHGRVAVDESTRIELFESGFSDFIELGVAGLLRYEEDPRLISFRRQGIFSIEANRNNPELPILASPTFRRALYFATDRATVANLINAAPAHFFLSTVGIALADGTAYRDTYEASRWLPENYGFNPALAVALLTEALEKYNMDSISLSLIYGEDMPGLRTASEFIQFQWGQVFGDLLTLSLRAMPHPAVSPLMRASVTGPTADWDLAWSRFMPRAESFAPHERFAWYTSTSVSRFTNYQNALLDALFPLFQTDEIRLDERRRLELTAKLEEYFVLGDVTAIPVFQEMAFVMFSQRVQLPLDVVSPIISFGWQFGDILVE